MTKLTKYKKLDKRTKSYAYLKNYWRLMLAVAVLAFILTALIVPQVFKALNKATSNRLEQVIKPETINIGVSATFNEIDGLREPINYIRYRGEQLEQSNNDIMKMIRIAKCESGFDQYAKNPTSTAKGIYQFIDGTWRANCLKNGNVYDFIDNINCAWKVYMRQGDTPWHSSQGCWGR